jgi:hypothetical protein
VLGDRRGLVKHFVEQLVCVFRAERASVGAHRCRGEGGDEGGTGAAAAEVVEEEQGHRLGGGEMSHRAWRRSCTGGVVGADGLEWPAQL